ncbi:MAG: hypothetical protein ACREEL_00140 [Stellaceae bacterium]
MKLLGHARAFLYLNRMHLDQRELWIADHAEHFVACAFRGRGCYERVRCATIGEARAGRP